MTVGSRTSTTELYELPEGIRFDVDSGGARHRGEIEAVLTVANQAFGEIFGAEVTEATVFIYDDLEGQREAVSSFFGVNPSHLNFGPRAQAWPRAAGFYTGRMTVGQHVIVHELFHVLQAQMAHPDGELLPLIPSWISEGGAEYAAFTVREESPQLSGPNTDPGAGCRGLEQNLAELEPDVVGGQVYCHGLNAVRLLVDESGNASMLEFWERQGAGEPWREAFQNTFGKTVEEFYTEFDEWNTQAPDLGNASYGDHPTLDELHDGCAAGSLADCDMLLVTADSGSEYESMAVTCGGLVEEIDPTSTCMDALQNFSETDDLARQCAGGLFVACDAYLRITDVASEDKALAASCGGIRDPSATTPCWVAYGFGSR